MLDIYKLHSNPEKLLYQELQDIIMELLTIEEKIKYDIEGDFYELLYQIKQLFKNKSIPRHDALMKIIDKWILKTNDIFLILEYAAEIRKNHYPKNGIMRWPEAEPILKQYDWAWDEYKKYF